MARVQLPCLSVTASGSIGKTVTYSTWNGIKTCKTSYLKEWNGYYFKRKIHIEESIKQRSYRCIFSQAVKNWNELPQFIKDEYREMAKGKALTGMNIYIKDYINENYNYENYNYAYLSAVHFCFLNEAMKLKCNELVSLGMLYECNN